VCPVSSAICTPHLRVHYQRRVIVAMLFEGWPAAPLLAQGRVLTLALTAMVALDRGPAAHGDSVR
jgi:hypothetical protein